MEDLKTILIEPSEARKILGVGRNRMYTDLLKRKDFPCFKIGNKYFINRQLLIEWASNQCKAGRY
jgi:hypothetical protein